MKTLGLFDSGLGGYTIYKALKEAYPNINIVFYADQKNAPLGIKCREELKDIMFHNMQWFSQQGITDVFLACNTASTLINELRERFPHMNIMGIIDITIQSIPSSIPRLLILATKATIESNAYETAIKKIYPNLVVESKYSTQLVDVIEQKIKKDKQIVLQEVLQEYQDSKISILLGCTHYPIYKKEIEEYVKGNCYDSILPSIHALSLYQDGNGICRIVSTYQANYFKFLIKQVFDVIEEVEEI